MLVEGLRSGAPKVTVFIPPPPPPPVLPPAVVAKEEEDEEEFAATKEFVRLAGMDEAVAVVVTTGAGAGAATAVSIEILGRTAADMEVTLTAGGEVSLWLLKFKWGTAEVFAFDEGVTVAAFDEDDEEDEEEDFWLAPPARSAVPPPPPGEVCTAGGNGSDSFTIPRMSKTASSSSESKSYCFFRLTGALTDAIFVLPPPAPLFSFSFSFSFSRSLSFSRPRALNFGISSVDRRGLSNAGRPASDPNPV